MDKQLELHYNFFDSIEEQLTSQDFYIKDVGVYEQAKDSILYLYIHKFLTYSEKDKCLKRLHQEIKRKVKQK